MAETSGDSDLGTEGLREDEETFLEIVEFVEVN